MTGANAAIVFQPDAFDADKPKVMGRNVAGASFLDGFVRHADVDRYVGCVMRQDYADPFRTQVEASVADRESLAAREVSVLGTSDHAGLSRIGCVSLPDPQIGRMAWARRPFSQRAYSLCGITHTISSQAVMEAIGRYLVDPVQRWDALICSSTSVKLAVEQLIDRFGRYAEQRFGARPELPLSLPVIPLGLDAARFERLGSDPAARSGLRARIGAGETDTVLLFFGRLSLHAKAHPLPMLLAAQRAAETLDPAQGRLHFLFTGQFPNEFIEGSFRSATDYCPDVAVHFLDGAEPGLAAASWAAADVFVSLSDNIQESFGITPIEAMAAGLPCVVSDWDGYRDTVVDGETGFLIPTWLPPAGTGVDLARSYAHGSLSYDRFIGYVSQATAVDIRACADRLGELARSPSLRRRMADAARRRASEVYDWSRIIPRYQALWAELGARRRSDSEVAAPDPLAPDPRLPDPMLAFAGHASDPIDQDTGLELSGSSEAFEAIVRVQAYMFAAESLLPRDRMLGMIAAAENGPITVAEALGTVASGHRSTALRTVGWLAKHGIFQLSKR